MFKRILSILLSCCLMLSVMAIPVVADGATASATNASGYRGDTVEITISLANCGVANGMSIALSFDESLLAISSGKWLPDSDIANFNKTAKKGVFASVGGEYVNLNGEVFTLKLTVADDAAIGDTVVTSTLVVTDDDGTLVNQTIESTVTVLCNHIGGYENDYDDCCGICGDTRVICTPTMTVSGDLKADRTDKFELTVSLADCVVNGNTTVANGLGLTYEYDTTVLKLVEDECEWLIESPLCSFDGENSKAALATETEFDPNTQLCTLVFEVLDEAALGNTAVKCSLKIMNGSFTLAIPEAIATVDVTNLHTYDDAYDLECNDEGCVHDRAICGFTISALPTKLEYRKNSETLDVTGGMLVIEYDDGTTQETEMLLDQVSGFDNTILGKATLSVDIAGFSQTFEIEITVIRGDVNGDEKVNTQDAIRVLYHTFFPDDEAFPVNQDCDFNGDGKENTQDAIRVLYYSFFPDDPTFQLK